MNSAPEGNGQFYASGEIDISENPKVQKAGDTKAANGKAGLSKVALIIIISVAAVVVVVAVVLIIVFVGLKTSGEYLGNYETDSFTSDFSTYSTISPNENNDSTISTAGKYVVSGNWTNQIVINANGDVTLGLNGLNMTTNKPGAIVNKSTHSLIIELADETTNSITDGTSDETNYTPDAAIFSAGPLKIRGNSNSNLTVSGSYQEGIATEDQDLTINGGTIVVTSIDDGINAGGDNGGVITINGGVVKVTSTGDGIDSNKTIVINGGEINVYGPSNGDNAAIDSDDGIYINGGEVVAFGTSMLESPKENSKQYIIVINLTSALSVDTEIQLIESSSGEAVLTGKSSVQFKTLILSTPEIEKGKTYSLQYKESGGTSFTNLDIASNMTIKSIITTVDSSSSGPGNNTPPGGDGGHGH